jgi:1,4-dihydroxy-2-naphthoate octaprenyltransferase
VADWNPAPVRVWLQAIRIFSFTASIIPILVGSALALVDDQFDLPLFVVMLLASVACHAGANLANDYFDHRKGIDTSASLGPSKVIQQGLLTAEQVKRGMIVAFGIATVLGLIVVAQTGWEIFALALASLAAAYLYTGGPKPLGYIALGELVVLIFMGPVMIVGAYYVHTGDVTAVSVLVSLPIAMLVAAILHANNVRDIPLDRAAGKKTLAIVLGRRGATYEYWILVCGAFLLTVIAVVTRPELWPVLLVIPTAPVAFRLCRNIAIRADAHALNRVLRATAGLHMRFGTLYALGLLLAAIVDRLS